MIVAVVSRKGGVGKTTTAVNLAAALAAAGRRVLLVDLDPNAGASSSLGVPRHAVEPGAARLLLGHDGDVAELVRAVEERLDVVPASVDLRRAEAELVHHRAKELVLRRALAPLAAGYDDVFLDCPSGFGLATRNALAAAGGYLVPTAPHFLALDGLEPLVAAVERQSARLGVDTALLGIVLTMVDYRIRSLRATLRRIRGRFGEAVFAVEVRTNVRLAEAPGEGHSIFGFDPRSTGAEAYRLLAGELLLRQSQLARRRAPPPVAVAEPVLTR